MNENVRIAKRWFEEVWNQRRTETIDELLTEESICHSDDGPVVGPQQFRERMHSVMLGCFPDLYVTLEEVVSEGQDVVVRWTATATHAGEGLGIEPSGKAVSFRGITWARIVDGKLMEGWQSSNIPATLRTLAEQPAVVHAAPELGGW